MPPFQLRGKTLFLTYSQITDDGQRHFFESPNGHYDFICDTLGTPSTYRLARERHEDGGIHAHCYISFPRPIRLQSERRLDFGFSHPNIQPVRRGLRTTWEYTGKDGDVIFEHGDPPEESGPRSTSQHDIWTEIISQSSETDFYETCRRLAPKYYVLYRAQLERYCVSAYHQSGPTYSSPRISLQDPPAELAEWVEQSELGQRSGARKKSLILWGPTRTGKTLWARSLGRYVFSHS